MSKNPPVMSALEAIEDLSEPLSALQALEQLVEPTGAATSSELIMPCHQLGAMLRVITRNLYERLDIAATAVHALAAAGGAKK